MEIDYNKELSVKRIKKHSFIGRFLKKIIVSDVLFHEGSACWEWQASTDKSGYGRFTAENEHYAHIQSYLFFVGPIPEDKEIDHRCRRRHCVSPFHLEAVPHKVNQERMSEARTSCINGHSLTPENTFQTKGQGRGCKKCRYQRIKDWRARNPEKARQTNTEAKALWRLKQSKSDNVPQ